NPSGSFVYVLSGLHGLHIVSGVVVLIVALVAAFRMQIHSKNMNLIEMCATYWHFLDVLWLYLFLFMLFNR
ncbi:MAG: cytochrome c oxidase subunit 3, partial [Chryseotalea sp.]